MPREVFVAGQILTAAEMNIVSDQTVMVFAGTAARGSAIPTPSEGMVTYLSDSNLVEAYTGAAFTPVGGLVAVKSVVKTNTFSASVGAGANVAITDLSITHEVANASNKLIISAFTGQLGTSDQVGNVGLAIHDGTGLIVIGDTAGSRTRLTTGGRTAANGSTAIVNMPSFTFVYTPGTGSKTYTLRAVNINAGTQTLYVNRSEGDSDTAGTPRGVSSLVIQEVAG